MEIFLTADSHWGHRNIIRYADRPFHEQWFPYDPDVEAMNEALVDNWNAVVGPQDLVYHLGDVAMGSKDSSLTYISRLNGTKILLPGNHDSCWVGHKGAVAQVQKYLDAGFDVVHRTNTIEIGGYLACHFPYSSTAHDERYAEWRPKRQGRKLIHGHIHTAWKTKDDDQLNVGVDVWDYTPVNIDTIKEVMPL